MSLSDDGISPAGPSNNAVLSHSRALARLRVAECANSPRPITGISTPLFNLMFGQAIFLVRFSWASGAAVQGLQRLLYALPARIYTAECVITARAPGRLPLYARVMDENILLLSDGRDPESTPISECLWMKTPGKATRGREGQGRHELPHVARAK